MPLIQKTKLNTSSVFGSTLNLFSTQSKKGAEKEPIPNPPPKQANELKQPRYGTDTNFRAAMELLKV